MAVRKNLLCPLLLVTVMLVLCGVGTSASKNNDITYNDILVWTEDHSTKHGLSRRRHPMTMDELKAKVKQEKMNNLKMSKTCAERALHRCDIASMAKLLMMDDSPCTLLKEYMYCISQETKHCTTGDARILTTSLDSLVIGLRSSGHCVDINTQSDDSISRGSMPQRPCGRRGVWMCTTALVEDLKSQDLNTCSSMAEYRHCIHQGTQPCARNPSDALLRGTKGLARLYRKLTKQC